MVRQRPPMLSWAGLARRTRLTVSGLLLAIVLAACGLPSAGTTTSGIKGQVSIGPMCPVMQANLPCPDQPYAATIRVLDQDGKKVTEITSDAQGNFKVGLPPGTYVLSPLPGDSMAHAPEQPATVVDGQFTRVTITYDSGIR